MNVVNVLVAGVNRRMSEGWTFCGPAPSYMLDNNRVCVAASQVGPSRKLNPSAIRVAAGFGEGSGGPKGPPAHGPPGVAAEATVPLRAARVRTATATAIGPGFTARVLLGEDLGRSPGSAPIATVSRQARRGNPPDFGRGPTQTPLGCMTTCSVRWRTSPRTGNLF